MSSLKNKKNPDLVEEAKVLLLHLFDFNKAIDSPLGDMFITKPKESFGVRPLVGG